MLGDHPELECHSILKSEVTEALRSMKNNKAPGNDNIMKEFLEACGDIGISKLAKVMNKIYESGCIPQQMKESIFIPIPKKGDLLNCSNYHLISLISHVSKIFIRIIMSRVKKAIHTEVGWEQFAFRKTISSSHEEISWIEKKSNEELLEMVGEDWNLLKIIHLRQLRFVGHITREDSIEKMSSEGRLEGSRRRGRQRKDFLQGLVTIVGMKTTELVRSAYDRNGFKKMVANARY